MPRLPIPGSDDGTWGSVLNDFLQQSLGTDGQLKSGVVGSSQLQSNAISEAKLDTALAAKVNGASSPVTSVAGKTGVVTLVKADVGLANVDNTSDANKPVSTATQTALNGKVNTSSVGVNSGVASLDTDGKLVETQVPNRLSNADLNSTIESTVDSKLNEIDIPALVAAAVSDATSTTSSGNGYERPTRISALRGWVSRRDVATPVTIVFAGSSSTAGSGASTDANRWVNRFVERLRLQYPLASGSHPTGVQTLTEAVASAPSGRGIFGVNSGITGGAQASNYLTPTTRGQVVALNPRAIFHMVGSNDYATGVTPASYKASITTQIEALDTAMTTPHVHILTHSYPRFDSAAQSGHVADWTEYRQALVEIADAHPATVALLDVSMDFNAAGVTGAASTDPIDIIASDNMHMNDYGHLFMADLMFTKVVSATAVAQPIVSDTTPPVITTTSLNPMTSNGAFSQTIAYTGSTATSVSVSAGTIPTGLAASLAGGIITISGTPTGSGAYNFTLQATNPYGSDTQVFTGSIAASSGIVTSDSFNRTSGSSIGGSSADAALGGSSLTWAAIDGSGTWAIDTNTLSHTGASARCALPVTATDYEISAIISTLTSTSSGVWSISGRKAVVASTGSSAYGYRVKHFANGTVLISKLVAGVETDLWTSSAGAVTTGDRLGLRMIGTSISATKNGTILQTITDSSVTSSAYAGFDSGSSITGKWDDLKIET